MKPLDHVRESKQAEGGALAHRALTPIQEHYLSRMEGLIQRREEQLRDEPGDKLALRLLARALYATYMDCMSVGVGDEANALMERAQSRAV